MAVKNRLSVLIEEKSARDKHRVTLVDIAKATGINRQTLTWWRDNENKERYEARVIDKLCEFFECGVGDLLYREPDKPSEPEREPA